MIRCLATAIGILVAPLLFGCSTTPRTFTTCQFDDGPQELCTSPVTYPDVEPGTHTVTVRAQRFWRDAEGELHASEVGSDSWTWTVVEP